MLNRIVRINAGGRRFETLASTLCRFDTSPISAQTKAFLEEQEKTSSGNADSSRSTTREMFLDVDPTAFGHVLQFLRSGSIMLPSDSETVRRGVVDLLGQWDLTAKAFPLQSLPGVEAVDEEGNPIEDDDGPQHNLAEVKPIALPDVLVVQVCDNLTHEQGIKKHNCNITFGSDGFQLRHLCKRVRADMKQLLSTSYWQMFQTNERSAVLMSTRLNNASADLLLTSLYQRVVEHTERMGYHMVSSYVTLSPDAMHLKTRLLVHSFVFRRVRTPHLEQGDFVLVAEEEEEEEGSEGAAGNGSGDDSWGVEGLQDKDGSASSVERFLAQRRRRGGRRATKPPSAQDDDLDETPDEDGVVFKNYEPPHVGPLPPKAKASRPDKNERIIGKIWE